MTTQTEALKRIARELRYYNPLADEYKGEFIHKGWATRIEKLLAQPEQEFVEDLQAKLKWATEQLEANINWEFVAAAKEEMLKAAWAEIKELREQIKEPEQERCVGCEACIDTACGRDECPKGWPKAAQPEQEPVATVKRNSSGQIYIEWRDGEFAMANLVETKFYTTPPQRKPLPYERVADLWLARFDTNEYDEVFMNFARAIEAAHGIKE